MHEEAEIKLTPLNTEKTFAKVNELIHQGICLVAVDGGRIVGTMAGTQIPKGERASRAAVLLVKKFMKVSKEIFPEDKIRLAHVFSGDCSRKDNFFERLGLKKAGSVFLEV